MPLNIKTRLFVILFTLGFIGILSFLLVDLAALVASFPVPPGTEPPVSTTALKLLSLIQPTVLLAIAVVIGVFLAPRVGLASPFAESLAAGRSDVQVLKSQVLPGVLGGAVGGMAILVAAAVFRSLITTELVERLTNFGKLLPLATRFLYGGLTEELLLRWGLMTLLVWVTWRLFERQQTTPTAASFFVAILVSSVVFGILHLPIAVMLLGGPTPAIVVYVIVANSLFGIVAGYLYWKYGLESAMIAHILAHVVMAVASYAGLYF